MSRRIITVIFVLLLSVYGNVFVSHAQTANGTIYLRSDGTIDPSTAPIQRVGDLYILNGNITSNSTGIVIQRDNMTLNGQGYWIFGSSDNLSPGSQPYYAEPSGIYLEGCNDVSIKNVSITNFDIGIVVYTSAVSIVNSTLDHNYAGIYVTYTFGGPEVYGTNITNNSIGVAKAYATGLVFSHDNFIGNQAQVSAWYGNAQDDLWNGNYWSDYNGTGNTPYINNNNYQGDLGPEPLALTDNYPLMTPYSTSTLDSAVPEFSTITIIFLFIILFIGLSLSILVRKKGD